MSEEREVIELLKYRDVFPKAWKIFLKKIEEGKIHIPANEAELRCHLFSECLSIMHKQKLHTPYEIFVEEEILEGHERT